MNSQKKCLVNKIMFRLIQIKIFKGLDRNYKKSIAKAIKVINHFKNKLKPKNIIYLKI